MAYKNDDVLTNFDEQFTRWTEFYKEYLNDPVQNLLDNDSILTSTVPQRAYDYKSVNWNLVDYSI